jgi:hypothetical protein
MPAQQRRERRFSGVVCHGMLLRPGTGMQSRSGWFNHTTGAIRVSAHRRRCVGVHGRLKLWIKRWPALWVLRVQRHSMRACYHSSHGDATARGRRIGARRER